MMSRGLAVSIAAGGIAWAQLPAMAQSLIYTAKLTQAICRDRETLDRMRRILASSDEAAWGTFSREILLQRRCVVVAKGEVVFGSVEGNIGGVLRVRRKGDNEEYLAISDFFAVSR
jgi:hypothetical protein